MYYNITPAYDVIIYYSDDISKMRAALQYFTKFTMVLSTYFTTVYNTANNTKSGFTIYRKIYNGALRTLTIFYAIYNGFLSMYFLILLNMSMLMLIE